MNEKTKKLVRSEERAERLVLAQARYIAKYIHNGHSCVQHEPAIQRLVKLTRRLIERERALKNVGT